MKSARVLFVAVILVALAGPVLAVGCDLSLPDNFRQAGTDNKTTTYESSDREIKVKVLTGKLAQGQTAKDLYQAALNQLGKDKTSRVTYKKITDDWYVITGYVQNDRAIFYTKAALKDRMACFATAWVPPANKNGTPVAKAIAKTLSVNPNASSQENTVAQAGNDLSEIRDYDYTLPQKFSRFLVAPLGESKIALDQNFHFLTCGKSKTSEACISLISPIATTDGEMVCIPDMKITFLFDKNNRLSNIICDILPKTYVKINTLMKSAFGHGLNKTLPIGTMTLNKISWLNEDVQIHHLTGRNTDGEFYDSYALHLRAVLMQAGSVNQASGQPESKVAASTQNTEKRQNAGKWDLDEFGHLIIYKNPEAKQIIESYNMDCNADDKRYVPLIYFLAIKIRHWNAWFKQENYIVVESVGNEARAVQYFTKKEAIQAMGNPVILQINKWGEISGQDLRVACFRGDEYPYPIYIIPK
jgi:hypothetical protein